MGLGRALRVSALLIVAATIGCSALEHRRAVLEDQVEWSLKDVQARIDAAVLLEKPRAARLGEIKKELQQLKADLGRADEKGERGLSEAEATHQELQRQLAEVEAHWKKRSALEAELQQLRARYAALAGLAGSDSPEKRIYEKAIDVLGKAEKVLVRDRGADEVGLLREKEALDLAGEAVEDAARAVAEVDPDLARHTKLVGEIEAWLARAKLRRDEWPDGSKRKDLVKNAIAILEAAKPRLHKDTKPVTDPAVLKELESQVQLVKETVLQAESEVIIYPNPWFRLHAGFATIAPYVLKRRTVDNNYVLDRGSDDAAFYAEVDYLHRQAWLTDGDTLGPDATSVLRRISDLAPSDHEIRVRFTNQESEIENGSTAATGDWAAEGSAGWPLLKYCLSKPASGSVVAENLKKTEPKGSINFELNGGIVADREALDVHSFAQAGIGSAWAFPVEIRPKEYRAATFYSGVYYGLHEFPRIDVDDVVYSNRPRPHFNTLGALGVKIDVTYPFSEYVELVIGARLAACLSKDDVPENWSLFVGFTVPLGKLFGTQTSR
jgi:hypothetical protein